METRIIRVEKNSFIDEKTGELISYSKIACLVPIDENNENKKGYDVESYTLKSEYYTKLIDLFKANKLVEIEFELVKVNDKGHYKKKPIKINDWEL